MTDIVIQGIYGRMGHALIEKIAARQDCRVVAGVDREAGKVGDIPVYAGFEGLPKVDAIIDFQERSYAIKDEMRAQAAKNEQEMRVVMEDGRQRLTKLLTNPPKPAA